MERRSISAVHLKSTCDYFLSIHHFVAWPRGVNKLLSWIQVMANQSTFPSTKQLMHLYCSRLHEDTLLKYQNGTPRVRSPEVNVCSCEADYHLHPNLLLSRSGRFLTPTVQVSTVPEPRVHGLNAATPREINAQTDAWTDVLIRSIRGLRCKQVRPPSLGPPRDRRCACANMRTSLCHLGAQRGEDNHDQLAR